METIDDSAIVALAKLGDEKAFEELLSRSLVKIKPLLALHFKLQPIDLDEIIQVSTIKAWKRLSSFQGKSSFSTWLYIIMKNEAIDFLKKRNFLSIHEISAHRVYSNDEQDEDYEHLSVEQTFEETAASLLEKRELIKEYRKLIEETLKSLAPPHSQIIQMVLEEGKSYKQISQELGVPMGTVMSRLFYARKEAQKLIIQYAKRNALQLTCVGEC